MSGLERIFAPTAPGAELGEPAGLYVHVPFCSAICPYCDFAVSRAEPGDRARYVASLAREIDRWRAPGVRFDTVYLGGGTPSMLSAGQLEELLRHVGDRFELSEDVRISLEANPEDVDESAVAAWRSLGVHTVSLGVQAWEDEDLRRLGRRHRRELARRAVELSVAAGFAVVSVDLIYGLVAGAPWRSAVETAVESGISHLSCYELTVHEGTPFWRLEQRGRSPAVGETERADWFLDTHRLLDGLGWSGYEASNFARRESARSRHNQKYWRHVPYLGLGPSAHSFDGTRRWWNARGWRDWSERVERGDPVGGEERLGPAELGLEVVMLGLRTRDGFDLDRHRRVSGFELETAAGHTIDRLEAQGLIERTGRRLRPTLEGMAIGESLALHLTAGLEVPSVDSGGSEDSRRRTSRRREPREEESPRR